MRHCQYSIVTVAIGNATQDRRVDAVFLDYDNGTLTLTIGPNALQANDGQTLTVYSAMKVWRVAPPTFTAQKTPPFAIMGSPRAGFINEPLSFVGEFSYSPVGRTIDEYAWKKFSAATLVSGDQSVANTEDAPLVLSWDTAGEYLVRLKVTDSAGEVGKSFRPVLMILNGKASTRPTRSSRCKTFATAAQDWSAGVTVYGVADNDTFPRQGLIVVWAEDWYGAPVDGAQASIGGQYHGASEVVFCGWIRTGSVTASAEENSVTFTIDSAETQLQGSRCLPSRFGTATMRRTGTPLRI
jgi:hypothetical protein